MHDARTKIIYGFYASDLKSIGYVGQTSDLARRSHRHLNISTRKPRNIDIWIKLQNKNVVFITLEECEWVDPKTNSLGFQEVFCVRELGSLYALPHP